MFDDLRGYLIRHRGSSDQLHQETMSNILDKKLSAVRMHVRDTAGGRIDSNTSHKKRKKTKGHYRKNWDIDLWD